jgi:predicted Zn-ribbon and HTH transcriptional regulator
VAIDLSNIPELERAVIDCAMWAYKTDKLAYTVDPLERACENLQRGRDLLLPPPCCERCGQLLPDKRR